MNAKPPLLLAQPQKQKINIALDSEVVVWFKRQAGGRGYQTLINTALREAMQHKTVEETLRKVIREELKTV
ncbi:MAG: BrnA antitoxin family protein [Gallionella sp.]